MSTVVPYILLFLAAPIPGMLLAWLGFKIWQWGGTK